ncbi:putative Histidine phosphatase superfamily [Seiridium cardinale]
MPPTLILVRHAQALHNIDQRYYLHDPDLSEMGFGQLKGLRESLMKHPVAQNAGLIITSPMRRTIQTALGSVDWLISKGIKLEADADWQGASSHILRLSGSAMSGALGTPPNIASSSTWSCQNSAKPCDTGTPAPALGKEFPVVDFATLDVVYPDKSTPAGAKYAYNKKALLSRGQSALKKLYDRPEKVIIVVSHSGFLRLCISGCWFFNSDYRIFDFEEHLQEDAPYKLKQSSETLENGGGLGLSFKHSVELGSDLPEENPSNTR